MTLQKGVGGLALGIELRRLRQERGLSLEYLAGAIGTSPSTLSRLERGQPAEVAAEEVSALLGAMRVIGEERAKVMQLATGQGKREYGLWESLDPDISDQVYTYLSLERMAKRTVNVAPLLIPGLLQTADYCRALFTAMGVHDSRIHARMARRLGRKSILELADAPDFLFVISELVLRQPVGSELLMAQQVRHIMSEANRARVAVRVVPQTVVAHPGLLGSFTLLEFEDQRTIAYIESRMSAFFLESPAEVADLVAAAERQTAMALSEEDSFGLLRTIAEDLEMVRTIY